MAEFPAGPELDRAVAIAMGHGPVSKCFMHRDGGTKQALPNFSTDPRHTAEMLTWLRPHPEHDVVIVVGKTGVSAVRLPEAAEGATIPEALSRLVVAVKEASGG